MGLTLEESIEKEKDQREEIEGVSFVFEKRIASYVDDKVIDFVMGPRSGFQIKNEGPDFCCGTCSC